VIKSYCLEYRYLRDYREHTKKYYIPVQCLPISLIVLGIFLFIFSALGFIFAGVESKPALFGYAIVMAIISLAQVSIL
jgi:hypothetical protein